MEVPCSSGSERDLDDDNVYVQELRKVRCFYALISCFNIHVKVFDACDALGEGRLDKHGIRELCNRLQLSRHFDFVLDGLLTTADGETREKAVAFPVSSRSLANNHKCARLQQFKKRFVRLLPEIFKVETAAVAANGGNTPRSGGRRTFRMLFLTLAPF